MTRSEATRLDRKEEKGSDNGDKRERERLERNKRCVI